MQALWRIVSLAVTAIITMLLPITAQSEPIILAKSRVYIAPSAGFETYLSAAIEKRRLALTLTNNRSTADYVIEGGTAADGIRVVDRHTGDVVFVWTGAGKSVSPRQIADSCARQLARCVRTPQHKSFAKNRVWEF